MRFVRRRLAALVLAVTACQFAGTAAVSVALCQPGAMSADAGATCTCAHGNEGECPLHKGHMPQQAGAQTKDCRCSGLPDGAAAMLAAMVSVAGPLVERQQAVVPDGASRDVFTASTPTLEFARPPVSPPPRG